MLCKTVVGVLPIHFIITSRVPHMQYLMLTLHLTTAHLQVPLFQKQARQITMNNL